MICKNAGIEYLRAHEAGRHGFGTELMIRQGVDPVTVAQFGRWKSAQLVLSTYGHLSSLDRKSARGFARSLHSSTRKKTLRIRTIKEK